MNLSPRIIRLITLALTGIVLVLNHQGCGDTALMMSPGNGSGYEGIRPDLPSDGSSPASAIGQVYLTAYFVVYGSCGNSPMEHVSVIQRINGQYKLLRQNCIDLSRPLLLDGEQVQTDPSTPNVLIYNEQEYVKESYD